MPSSKTATRVLSSAVVAAALLTALVSLATADNWPRFRGPNGTGIANDKNIPVTWSQSDFLWKTRIPGLGHSAPVIWGEHLFLTTALDEGRVRAVLQLDAATGEIRWLKEFPYATVHKHEKNSYASSTPATDGERLYVAFSDESEYTLMALDFRGNVLWRQSLGPFVSQHSNGTSPILFEDLVIIANDQDGPSSVVACDKSTGKVRWKHDRKYAEQATAYGTPFILERPGHKPEVIFLSKEEGLVSMDARSGAINWRGFPMPMRTVASPVLAQGLVIATCGGGGQGKLLIALPTDKSGVLTEKDAAWTRGTKLPYVPTPIVYGEHVFLWTDQGVISCVEPKTGNNLWTDRVTDPEGRPMVFSGSPICVDGKIYGVSEKGYVPVVQAGTEFKLLGISSIGEASHSTPAVANGRLYIRGFEHLFCVAPKPAQKSD